MMDANPLYVRSQVQDLTGLDSQTLDYWTRLGILRPVSGGGGKGHHRKYDLTQVVLGCILREAAQFGMGGNALATMASEFQASIDWFKANGLVDHAVGACSLVAYRHDLDEQGFTDINVASSTPPYNLQHRIVGDDWEGLVTAHQQGIPLPVEIVEKCKTIPYPEMHLHFDRFMALKPPSGPKSPAAEIFLSKNSEDGWEFNFELPPIGTRSYITIRLSDIKRELWRRQ